MTTTSWCTPVGTSRTSAGTSWRDCGWTRASTGNDLLIERECSHVSLAAAAVSAAHWREYRDRANGGFDAAGRALSAALASSGASTVWTPYARFDQVVPIDR